MGLHLQDCKALHLIIICDKVLGSQYMLLLVGLIGEAALELLLEAMKYLLVIFHLGQHCV
jgi:hypothetical protein